jgi:hypothetical protein
MLELPYFYNRSENTHSVDILDGGDLYKSASMTFKYLYSLI